MINIHQKLICDHYRHFTIHYTRSADVAYLIRVSPSVTVMEPSDNPENGERREDAVKTPEENKKTSKQAQLEQVPRMAAAAAARKVLQKPRGAKRAKKCHESLKLKLNSISEFRTGTGVISQFCNTFLTSLRNHTSHYCTIRSSSNQINEFSN